MSETRQVTRVRLLGDAVPVIRGAFRDASEDVTIVPKSSDEMRADRDARRDAAPMTTRCAVDGCEWTHTGTAGECRDQSAQHRASTHPGLVGARTVRQRKSFKKRGEPVDQAVVNESRRLRQERDDAQRLETIQRARRARGELDDLAEADPGDAGQAAASTTTREGIVECKIDGCQADASDAPKTGPTAKLCPAHRGARSAELSAARTGKPRKPRVTKTVIGVPRSAPVPAPVPAIAEQALRDPIRTADVPYDADVLEDEARFLRRRADALDKIAGGVRELAQMNEERAA